jgi:polysaccharide biosynthesis protein PslH
MRVLFLTQVLPLPLDAGPKIRAYYVLRYLIEAGHEVTLLTFVRREDPPEALQALIRLCHSVETVPMVRSRVRDAWSGVRSLTGTTPFLIIRDQNSEMRQAVTRISQNRSFDIVHADQLWMAPYALTVKGARSVLDQHNAVFQIPRRMASSEKNPLKKWLLQHEARKLAAYEGRICQHFDRVVWVSAADLQALTELSEGKNNCSDRSSVIPICIDPSVIPTGKEGRRRFRVTFMGGMHWPPNAEGIAWFSDQVWPAVRARCPDAVLTVIGRQPPYLGANPDAENIETPGFVPDPDRYLSETAVFIVPLHSGGGMRVKILDAWCSSLPVVSTGIGAEVLCVQSSGNIILADEPREFADAVIELLHNQELARRLSENGRATIQTKYDWRQVYRSWDLIYQ